MGLCGDGEWNALYLPSISTCLQAGKGFGMRPDTSRAAFESFVREHGESVVVLTPEAGVRLMLDFYRDVRAEGVAGLDENGDTLLFEWGTFDWGEGSHFQIDICRQFREAKLQDDDAISQLRLVFYFVPTEERLQLKDGRRWCDQPKWLPEFQVFVQENRAYQAVALSHAEIVELSYERN